MHQGHLRRISSFIEDNNIECELREFQVSCHSVREACAATGTRPEGFIKSICLISEDELVVGIVLGNDKVSREKVQLELDMDNVRMAKPDEVTRMTGYPIGGVPPFGYDAYFLIDEKVSVQPLVWAGGGSGNALIRVSPKEILRVTRGKLSSIRK